MKLTLIALLFSLFACAPGGEHKPVGETGPAGEFSTGGYDEVRPIFARYCAACHPTRSGPDWLDFNQATTFAKSGKLLRRIGIERSMPPPGSAQAAQLSESERLVIVNWAKAGGPQQSVTSRTAPQTSLPPEPSPRERMVQNCLSCHGAKGPDSSAQPKIPVLAGQNRDYIARQLTRFKWRERIDPTQTLNQTMNDIAFGLDESDIDFVAEYFSKQEAHLGVGEHEVPAEKRALYARGEFLAKRDCNSCHRNAENGFRPTSPLLPALSGQSYVYLMDQLIYFRDDERSNSLMSVLASELNNRDIEALATYYSFVR